MSDAADNPAILHGIRNARLQADIGLIAYELREKAGLTQSELAEKLHLSPAAIDDLEMGNFEDGDPSELLHKIAAALGVNLDHAPAPKPAAPPSKKTIRVGVIGAGAIGLIHLESWKNSPGIELAAVAEVNPQRRADAVALYPEMTGYADYREILSDKSIGAVSIGLPNFLHAPVAIEALRAGKHVLLEKPMAANAAEAQAIIDTAKASHVQVMVGQNFRFTREVQIIKAALNRGELGDVYHARAHWLRRSGIPRIGSWFTQKQFAAGGCGYDLGVHFLDLTMYLLDNFDAESVSGLTSANFGPRGLGDGCWGKGEVDASKPFDVEDLAIALIKLKGGKSIVMEISWALHGPSGPDKSIDIYGTDAGASLFPARIHRARGQSIETTQPDPDFFTPPLPEDRITHFADCILNGREPIVKPKESLKVQRVLDAIYESSKTGREVRL